jgi:hypothetical protein
LLRLPVPPYSQLVAVGLRLVIIFPSGVNCVAADKNPRKYGRKPDKCEGKGSEKWPTDREIPVDASQMEPVTCPRLPTLISPGIV